MCDDNVGMPERGDRVTDQGLGAKREASGPTASVSGVSRAHDWHSRSDSSASSTRTKITLKAGSHRVSTLDSRTEEAARSHHTVLKVTVGQ